MEGAPKQESRLDSLISKASQEAAQKLSQGEKFKAANMPAKDLHRLMGKHIESYVGLAREKSRNYAELLVQHKSDLQERIARYSDHPRTKEVEKNLMQMHDKIEQQLRTSLMKTVGELLKHQGVSEETTEALLREVSEQETKVVPFPKK
jgi:hypothetical protein